MPPAIMSVYIDPAKRFLSEEWFFPRFICPFRISFGMIFYPPEMDVFSFSLEKIHLSRIFLFICIKWKELDAVLPSFNVNLLAWFWNNQNGIKQTGSIRSKEKGKENVKSKERLYFKIKVEEFRSVNKVQVRSGHPKTSNFYMFNVTSFNSFLPFSSLNGLLNYHVSLLNINLSRQVIIIINLNLSRVETDRSQKGR